jgi:hypothetical protein
LPRLAGGASWAVWFLQGRKLKRAHGVSMAYAEMLSCKLLSAAAAFVLEHYLMEIISSQVVPEICVELCGMDTC